MKSTSWFASYSLWNSRAPAAVLMAVVLTGWGISRAGAQTTGQPDSSVSAAGARVRLTLRDSTAEVGRYPSRPNVLAQFEGTLVTLHPTSVDVRMASGDTVNFPASSLVHLERYSGDGACRASAHGERLCVFGGLLAAVAAGVWAGDRVATTLHDPYSLKQKWRWRGGIASGVFMMTLVLPVMGRDRWVPIPNWP